MPAWLGRYTGSGEELGAAAAGCLADPTMEALMSDYRNNDPLRDPTDPMRRDLGTAPDARAMNATWGWIAAAVFIVVVLAVAFGIGHQPGPAGTNTASNDATPPAATRMAPPINPGPPAATPTPIAPAQAPITPAPNSPAQRSAQ
jgi:hypothetical protein